jgi:hypothetical protein
MQSGSIDRLLIEWLKVEVSLSPPPIIIKDSGGSWAGLCCCVLISGGVNNGLIHTNNANEIEISEMLAR